MCLIHLDLQASFHGYIAPDRGAERQKIIILNNAHGVRHLEYSNCTVPIDTSMVCVFVNFHFPKVRPSSLFEVKSQVLYYSLLCSMAITIDNIDYVVYVIYAITHDLINRSHHMAWIDITQCCSQLVFRRGWWLKDQSIIVVLKTTSNKTDVRKEGGHPPFYLLATTL